VQHAEIMAIARQGGRDYRKVTIHLCGMFLLIFLQTQDSADKPLECASCTGP